MNRVILFALICLIACIHAHNIHAHDEDEHEHEAIDCEAVNLTSRNYASQYEELCHAYTELLVEEDPCSFEAGENYGMGIHIGAVFIILAASLIGSSAPLFASYSGTRNTIIPYMVAIGKSIGIGVILSVSMIHMLLPAVESLGSECLPESFTESYEGYAYLYAVLAIVVMHFIDFSVSEYMSSVIKDSKVCNSTELTEEGHKEHKHDGHNHGGLMLDPRIQKTISAYLLEFGVTVHSIFIGLTVGVADNETIKALLVAIVFHQFFEGLALGSRVAEAKLPGGKFAELMHISVFSVSAPLGIAIGIGIYSTLNPNGTSFLMVQGTFDAICAGILIYIGFVLLLKDFPEDLEKCAAGKSKPFLRKMGLFVGLWFGVAMMAFIGKYV